MAVSRRLHLSGALIALACAAPALADDPRDPAMTPEAIARDRETIRRLNRAQLDHVQQRDAGYAKGWRDHAAGRATRDHEDAGYTADRQDYASARADYARELREYDRAMAEWRRDVDACRAGYYERCDGR
ncbi:hypothetical protein V474_17330 [Novosphingobium barchaimii LL02]|uniref:Uncharacterized protein n=1 Tax=Novosphingobium barchaimii LL02 TaxID=1114963 RepID=A0A0J7XUT0_9SPHN|nr:hypothetical protein [Novosphingobium barchaimii]KMS54833.1 hypothetical protein V474_17330 [Novosphingobium barchaimii LL02]